MKLEYSRWVRRLALMSLAGLPLFLPPSATTAGPWVRTGDSTLRSDIQILADGGHIMSPTLAWPLSWGDIMAELSDTTSDFSAEELAALARVKRRMQAETRSGELQLNAHAAYAKNPIDIRSFEDTPRENAEIGVGLGYTGNWWATSLQGQWVEDPQDGDEWRFDDSYLGVALGNWMLAGAVTDRWWGPGWQGSLIMSNNARPVPAITLERNLTTPFKSKWLSWIGHWDLMVMWGFLEDDRDVPNANLFGLRLDFRPLKSLQIGFSRTAQMCGDGRPCGLDTFFDMLFGNDNQGINVDPEDEPGNQLAGVDARWAGKLFRQPLALYTQWVAEDGGDPIGSAWLGLFGGEVWGVSDRVGTWRGYLEWSDTTCGFRAYTSIRGDDDRRPGCAYNSAIYTDGYRYKGRAIGHSFDGDSSVFTLGGTLSDRADAGWSANIAYGNLNRWSARPTTTAQNKTRYRAFNLTHRRPLWIGSLYAGVGYDYRKDTVTGDKIDDVQFFLEYDVSY